MHSLLRCLSPVGVQQEATSCLWSRIPCDSCPGLIRRALRTTRTQREIESTLFHVVLKTFTKSVTVAERGSAHPQQIAVASSRCQMRVRELLFTVRFLQPRTCLHFVIRSCGRGFKETADSLTVLPRPTLLTNDVRTFSEQSTAFDFPIS